MEQCLHVSAPLQGTSGTLLFSASVICSESAVSSHRALAVPVKWCLGAGRLCWEEEQIRKSHWEEGTDGFQESTALSLQPLYLPGESPALSVVLVVQNCSQICRTTFRWIISNHLQAFSLPRLMLGLVLPY